MGWVGNYSTSQPTTQQDREWRGVNNAGGGGGGWVAWSPTPVRVCVTWKWIGCDSVLYRVTEVYKTASPLCPCLPSSLHGCGERQKHTLYDGGWVMFNWYRRDDYCDNDDDKEEDDNDRSNATPTRTATGSESQELRRCSPLQFNLFALFACFDGCFGGCFGREVSKMMGWDDVIYSSR
ncbi:hypothetical protein EX30DRAFT_230433 [Ascodesmis nigricans]|uniref:Uncharacterized protein n=1 Tax=Ascodesmis nigricans TaxID=341454 RepID=A0A4S2MNE7_9PEZI|nr:hypothetical protein EX30DRAFT_230433 [Ascodesmis nigricans]